MLRLLRILMRYVETHMVDAVNLHLLIDSPCHYVAWCQRQPFVVLLHKRLAVGQSQYAAISTHRLCDEISRMRLLGVVEHRGVELHKLHVCHRRLCAVRHCLTVARGNDGVRRHHIHRSASPCAHQRHSRQIRVHLLLIRAQHVRTIALYVGSASCDIHPQMVLSDNLHCEVMLLHHNVGACPHRCHQSALYLRPCVVGMVQYPELRVSSLAMQVKLTLVVAVEVHPPSHKLLYLCRSVAHHLLHCGAVRDEVTRNHRILDVLLEVVNL